MCGLKDPYKSKEEVILGELQRCNTTLLILLCGREVVFVRANKLCQWRI